MKLQGKEIQLDLNLRPMTAIVSAVLIPKGNKISLTHKRQEIDPNKTVK